MIKIIGTVLFIIMLIIIATSDDDYDNHYPDTEI